VPEEYTPVGLARAAPAIDLPVLDSSDVAVPLPRGSMTLSRKQRRIKTEPVQGIGIKKGGGVTSGYATERWDGDSPLEKILLGKPGPMKVGKRPRRDDCKALTT